MDDRVGELAVSEPGAKAQQGLPHEIENEANVSSVGALVLKIIDEVAYVGIAELTFISIIAQVFEDLPLKNGVVFSVAFRTQYLESAKCVLCTLSKDALIACQWVSRCLKIFWDARD